MFKKFFNVIKEFIIGKHLYSTDIKSNIIIGIRLALLFAYEVFILSTNKIHGAFKAIVTYGSITLGLLWALR